jgi:hypothetical protein
MDKLYEISDRYKNLEELLDNPELENIKEEIGKSLDSVNEEFEIKAENVAKIIKSKEVYVKGLDEEIKRLQDRKKTEENQIANLKFYLFEHMKLLKKDKIKGNLFTLSIKKAPPKVVVEDEKMIPKQYWIPQPSKLLKKDMLDALKNNIKIPGAKLEQGTTLGIR